MFESAWSDDGSGNARLIFAPGECQLPRCFPELARQLSEPGAGLDPGLADSFGIDATRLPRGACSHRAI